MKKFMLNFIIISGVALHNQVFSQPYEAAYNRPAPGFFMPESELAPRFEKLPPIAAPQTYQTPNAAPTVNPAPQRARKVSRYIAVDGRYIPVFEEDDDEDLTEVPVQITTDFDDEEELPVPEIAAAPLESTTAPAPLVREAAVISAPKPQPKQTISTLPAPRFEDENPQQPLYRSRYNQYLASLQEFQKTKNMPYNPELENTLAKLKSDKEIIIFQDTVTPK